MTLPQRMPPKQATNKVGDYQLVSKFPGYHAREDPTTLPVGTLVAPSQNVVIKTSGRVSLVAGYALDGAGSTVIDSGILSNYDFTNFKGDVRNMRAGFMTAAANDGKLQYRYGPTSTWIDLMTGLTNVRLCYATYWDNTLLVKNVLWVDGSNNVFGWNGSVTTLASATSNTVTKQDATKTWAQEGFSATGSIVIGGTTYTYSGGAATTTLTGVSPDPTTGRILLDSYSEIHQNSFGDIDNANVFGAAQSFISSIPSTVTKATFYIKKSGTPTGNIFAKIYAASNNGIPTGAVLATSDAFDISTLTTSPALADFTFSGGNLYTLTANTKYFISLDGGTFSGGQLFYGIDVAPTHTTATENDVFSGWRTEPWAMNFYITGTYAAGATVHQSVITVALSTMTAILATFAPTVIGCGRRNQVYLGSATSNALYISKVNSYTDYTFTSPTRVVGEGCLIPLDSPPVKFVPQEVNTGGALAYDMYISEGTDTWGIIRATLSSDLTKETLEHIRLKVAPLQGAKSERLVAKMKNEIMFVGNDSVANFLGLSSYQFVPAIVDFSYPIIDDMKSYDFTDASIFYHRNYVYIAIPKAGVVRIYNMTDQTNQYTTFARDMEDVTKQPWFWETPVTYPVSGFYVVAGELYGHSYTTSESYKLFTTGSFNGQQIDANATFAYDDKQDRTQSKGSDECWVEGYIKQNTVLNVTVAGDLDAETSSQTVTIDGSDNTIVAYGNGAHSLGTTPFGSEPLGGANLNTSTRPAWFHVAKTYPQVPFYLEQLSFSTKGVDLAWELLCFGTNSKMTPEGNNSITQ